MKLTFLGAAREVTGSCFLVETTQVRFLVDCGMVQGGREAPARNRMPFGFDPQSIDFVLLTHAHIDHSGLLPKLTRAGYKGPILATTATADLLQVMLPDSAHIQESEARRNRRRVQTTRGRNAEPEPLYTLQDAQECLRHVWAVPYDEELVPRAGVRCRFRDAGHILGSAIIEVWVSEASGTTKLVFSGDLGHPGRPILRDPTPVQDADILVIESTYGDRAHKSHDASQEELIDIVERTLYRQRGNVIIPAFAVGRTQEIIYQLHHLTREGRLRGLKIFVDSPMATEARRHMELFDDAARNLVAWHTRGRDLPYLYFTESAEESMALNKVRTGAIIISASGMCDAGRIRHHLRHNLPRRESSVLIAGCQAQGTLGRRLVDGAKRVRMFGQEVPVRAGIHTVGGLSAHADQPALLAWAGGFQRPPRQTCVVHGEAVASDALAEKLGAMPGWNVTVPEPGMTLQWPRHVKEPHDD